MTTVCSCSNRVCELFGCQQDARDRARLSPLAHGYVPPMQPPQLHPGQTREARQLTEAEIREIVRDEISKSKKD